MKKNWKKILMSSAVLGISALTLAACGSSKDDASGGDTNTSGSGDAAKIEGDLKLWVDTDHIKAIQGIVDNFVKENPDVKVEVKAGSSADAKADVSKDPEKAADVFMMPHDQVGQMAEAGLLYPVGTKQAETIKENNTEASVNGVTCNDKIYGYPYGVESQVLYYNKSKLSADDVKTWETLTAKGKIGTNFGEAGANYIFGPLFMSNGDVLFGENGEDLQGTNFNNDNGIQVLNGLLLKNQIQELFNLLNLP